MQLYVFSSSTLTNIWAGIGAHRWAVSRDQAENASIRTKAGNMPLGALGILYCVQTQAFTTPFVVTSKPDPTQTVTNIWPEPWRLPFGIFPLGTPEYQLHKDKLSAVLPSLRKGAQWDRLLHVSPATVFAPSQVSDEDWSALVAELVEH